MPVYGQERQAKSEFARTKSLHEAADEGIVDQLDGAKSRKAKTSPNPGKRD